MPITEFCRGMRRRLQNLDIPVTRQDRCKPASELKSKHNFPLHYPCMNFDHTNLRVAGLFEAIGFIERPEDCFLH